METVKFVKETSGISFTCIPITKMIGRITALHQTDKPAGCRILHCIALIRKKDCILYFTERKRVRNNNQTKFNEFEC